MDAFLKFNDREILQNAGTVSIQVAHRLAEERYEEFNHSRALHETENENMTDLKLIEEKIIKEKGEDEI